METLAKRKPVKCLTQNDFELKLCEAINAECGTNFEPMDCEKVEGIFLIQEHYGDKKFQRFSNFGKPCKFSPKALKDTTTVCIAAVKSRKERQENAT